MKPIHFLSLLFLLTLIACEKETGPSSRELLTGEPWKLKIYVLDYPNEDPIDGMTILNTCEKDDEYIFLEDDSYMLMDKQFRCPGTAPDIKATGSWTFSDDSKKLSIGGVLHDLLKLDADSLVLQEYSAQFTWTKVKRYAH